ncbi:MAG: metallophosphatase family protein [bacterium]|nr:metallophosphatase family protein [bacterium]
MKIAVISDIHGNMEALSAVLDDIKQQSCDKIFCLGDYAMAGPEPNDVIEKIIELKQEYNIELIQGNTDLMIAEYSEEIYNNLKPHAPVMSEALKNDSIIIKEDYKKILGELPSQLSIEEGGVKILLVHGSPRKNNENILPDIPLNEVENMIKGVEEDVVLCGHTHIPCGFQTSDSKTVVNAGSVGRPFTEKPDACYLILTINNGKCLFEHRFVDYDRQTASKKLLKRNFKGVEKLAQTLLNPKERHF